MEEREKRGFQQHSLGEWGWLFRHGGGFQRANLPSRLSETPSYLPESLAEPQLLRILSRDGELRGCRGRDALQLSWVQLAGVSGGYGARNGFRRAKRGRFSSRGWGFQRDRGVLPAGTRTVGGKKLNWTIRREPSGSPVEPVVYMSNSGPTTFRSKWPDRTGTVSAEGQTGRTARSGPVFKTCGGPAGF